MATWAWRRRRASWRRWADIENTSHDVLRLVEGVLWRLCFVFSVGAFRAALFPRRFGCQLARRSRSATSEQAWVSIHFCLLIFFLASLRSVFPRSLVSSQIRKTKKDWKFYFSRTQFSTINFNKISFSLDTSKKLHFAAKLPTFFPIYSPLPWLQWVDCGELIEKGRKIIGEIILQLSERDENSFHKNFFLPFHTRTNFLVSAPIERRILKNTRRFLSKTSTGFFRIKNRKKTFH